MPNDTPILYRKRLIPEECILLNKDILLYRDEHILVTKWQTIRPKRDLDHGTSCYFLDKGWKVSRFLNRLGGLICWYCDIVEHTYDPASDTYVFTDLLADVLLYPSGEIRVVDLNEIADAFEEGLLSPAQACACMRKLDSLLKEIYSGRLLASLPECLES